jgi:hypothetical protein
VMSSSCIERAIRRVTTIASTKLHVFCRKERGRDAGNKSKSKGTEQERERNRKQNAAENDSQTRQ